MKRLLLFIGVIALFSFTHGTEVRKLPPPPDGTFCYSAFGEFPVLSYTAWVFANVGYYQGEVEFLPYDDDGNYMTICYQAVPTGD